METLARTLNRSVRTVQRHLHLLRDRGLIEFVERRPLNSRKEQISAIDQEHREQTIKARKGEQHRKRGYEWFFE